MAKESARRKGVSLDSDDAIETGLFSSGPAAIKESVFAMYDYGGNSKPVPVWLVTYEREGENDYEQPYSLGKGWKVSKEGDELIPQMGQTGLPKSCNAIRHLVKPLKAALKEAGIDDSVLGDGDPRVLEGLEVVLRRVEQEKRNINEKGSRRKEGDDKERSILEIEEVTSAPWEKGSKSKSKPKGKAKDTDDDEDDDDDKDDEDEKPVKSNKRKPAADDDDEEEAAPARGGKSKDAGKAKGKSKADADDDDAEPDDETIAEEGVETLIEVLNNADDNTVPYDDLEGLVKREVKGHKHATQIVEWCVDTDNLELEKGWTYSKDKKTKEWLVALA